MTVDEALATCAPEWRPFLERLLDRVLERDGCWLLFRYRGRHGFRILHPDPPPGSPAHRKVAVSRLLYTLLAGLVPPGQRVCRTCAERRCVSPAHHTPRAPRRVAAFGRQLTFAEWERTSGIRRATLAKRILTSGWPVERALTEPPERRL